MKLPFQLVDVFAPAPYQGNQLAVFTQIENLSTVQMQQIAKEINFSECAFIGDRQADGAVNVRIFTPEYEVPFAGHPVLGTAFVLSQFPEAVLPICLSLASGRIVVSKEGELFWFKAPAPRWLKSCSVSDLEGLSPVLTGGMGQDWPAEVISTGLPYLIVPVGKQEILYRLELEAHVYNRWLLDQGLHKSQSPDGLHTGCYFFCTDPHAPDKLYARMLLLENGQVVEDAATGSAASCLLAYLLERSPQTNYQVSQGLHRSAMLYLRGSKTGDKILEVGGQVHPIAQGEWHIPPYSQ
jgi:trans-2,3-dihydro-3-hydroxyanthranilate isomerase